MLAVKCIGVRTEDLKSLATKQYLPGSGDVVWIDLDPPTGHEQAGRRPCIVLSDHIYSKRTGMAIICPITSKPKGLPFEVQLKGTKVNGAILPIHVRSVDFTSRFVKYIETAPPTTLYKTKSYVRIIMEMV